MSPKEREREDKGPQKLKDFTKKKYNGMAADKVRKSGASYENIYHSTNVWLQRLLELICVFLRGAPGAAGWGILHSSGLSELLCLFTIYWSQQQKNGWGAGRECHGEEGVHKYYYEKKRSAVNQMRTSQCPLSQRADPGCGNMKSDPASLNFVHLFYRDKKTSVCYI